MARQGWGEFKNKGKNYDRDINYDDKGKDNFKGKTIIKVNTMTNAKTMTMQTSSMQIQKQRQKEAQQKKVIFCENSCEFKNCATQLATKQNLNVCFQFFQCFQFTTMH